jgi:hypothetical protein
MLVVSVRAIVGMLHLEVTSNGVIITGFPAHEHFFYQEQQNRMHPDMEQVHILADIM